MPSSPSTWETLRATVARAEERAAHTAPCACGYGVPDPTCPRCRAERVVELAKIQLAEHLMIEMQEQDAWEDDGESPICARTVHEAIRRTSNKVSG